MPKKEIRLPCCTPRGYQLDAWQAFDAGARYMVISWPRRHGKDLFCFELMVREALMKVGTYYYYFPTLEDGKEILWNNVTTINGKSGNMIDLLCPEEIRATKNKGLNNTDHYITLYNGSRIKIGGTDNLKVIGVDGVGYVFSEWQGQKPESFEFVRPILRQNGGWVVFNGTMRGKENHLYKDVLRNGSVKNWFTQWLKPKSTKQYYWISPEGEDEEYRICLNPELEGKIDPATGREYSNIQDEVDSGMSYARARQEFLNEAISDYAGAYFSYELQVLRRSGSIGNFCGLKKKSPVYTSWDLGIGDMNAIVLFQEFGAKKRIVGYYENTGQKYEHYFNYLNSLGVEFGGHFVPHDAKKRSGETLSNFIIVAKENGFNVKPIPKTNSVKDDIEICRQQLKSWEIDLDGENVETLYDHLTKYRENPRTGRPDHTDDSSNGGDALRTAMMAIHRNIFCNYIQHKQEGDMEEYEDGYDDGGIYALDSWQ